MMATSVLSSSRFYLLALVVIGVRSELPPDMFGGGAKKECPPFRCPRGEEAVPKNVKLQLTSTGSCSGLGGGGMTMFNAKEKDDPLSTCCDVRQACEQICGSTLKQCDEAMEACMNSTCAAAEKPEDCERSASIHKLMTQLGDGCSKMVPAQQSNCECVESVESAPRRRREILTDLYKKNDGDLAKVDKLVEKANSPKKFASLLAKLVEKYPKTTIIQKKDPQAAYLDNLMKNAAAKAAANKENDEEEEIPEGDVVDLDHQEEL